MSTYTHQDPNLRLERGRWPDWNTVVFHKKPLQASTRPAVRGRPHRCHAQDRHQQTIAKRPQAGPKLRLEQSL